MRGGKKVHAPVPVGNKTNVSIGQAAMVAIAVAAMSSPAARTDLAHRMREAVPVVQGTTGLRSWFEPIADPVHFDAAFQRLQKPVQW